MKHKFSFLLVLLLAFSMLLTACGGTEAVVEEDIQVEEVEEPEVEEPEVEEMEEESMGVSEADLDASFQTFLADMEAYNTITLDALNGLMVEGSTPFLLDVREVSEAEANGHIEGAVMIPLRELGENTDKLPSTDTQIVSYCGSGWRCTIALTLLEGMGFEDVLCLKGDSYTGWKAAGYPTIDGANPEAAVLNEAELDAGLVASLGETAANVPDGFGGIAADALNTEIVENEDLLLIDVRTDAEVEDNGYVDAPNLSFIPLQNLIDLKDMWPAELDGPIVVYCGSGHRSTIAMTILWAYGYTDVQSLKGGFGGWVSGGFPVMGAPEVEAGMQLDTAFQVFLDDMEGYNTITLDTLNTMFIEENVPFIVDVRSASEAEEKGHIEGSILIPLRDLGDNIDLLPGFDTQIVTYCGSGWRCTIASTALEAIGYEDVLCLKGGSYGGWLAEGYPVVEGLQAEAPVLDAVDPDDAILETIDGMLDNVPEGYGGISADGFNTELLENSDLVVLDVRTAAEVEENGLIEAADWSNVPLQEFITMQDLWPDDLDAPIVVYCGSGHRSTIAMTILWSYGYTNVRSLQSGFGGWVDAGYPVVEFVAP